MSDALQALLERLTTALDHAHIPFMVAGSFASTARDAFRRSMFNVIDLASGWKIDFILRKNRAFSRSEMERRVAMPILGVPMFVASPEDTIVAKLEWSRESGGSERQRRDVMGIVRATAERLDRAYVEKWIRELDLDGEWQAAQTVMT